MTQDFRSTIFFVLVWSNGYVFSPVYTSDILDAFKIICAVYLQKNIIMTEKFLYKGHCTKENIIILTTTIMADLIHNLILNSG